jgi:hypothetical protein
MKVLTVLPRDDALGQVADVDTRLEHNFGEFIMSISTGRRLKVKLSGPYRPGRGTKSGQSFAAGWLVCSVGLTNFPLDIRVSRLPDIGIDAELDFCPAKGEAYDVAARRGGCRARRDRALVEAANEICRYSRGNADRPSRSSEPNTSRRINTR